MVSEVSEVKSLSEYLAALSDIRVRYGLSSDPNYSPLILRGEDKLYSYPCSSRAARVFREPYNSFFPFASIADGNKYHLKVEGFMRATRRS